MIALDGVGLETLVLASGNRHKYEEFRGLLAPLGITLKFGGDYENPIDVDETGTTFIENATQKATAWAKYTGLPALSDDSGIEIRALGWRPGIFSSRVGHGDEEEMRQWLIANMAGKSDRVARYAAALALVFPDGTSHWQTLCHCYGTVIQDKRGTNGFGYDPLFIPDGFEQTFGELSTEVKAKISHRAKASHEFISMLRALPTTK